MFICLIIFNQQAELAADVYWKKKYRCPAYQISVRRPCYVFDAQLATSKHPAAKWILAGVAMILDKAETQMVPYGGEGAPSSMSPAVNFYDGNCRVRSSIILKFNYFTIILKFWTKKIF